MVEKSKLNLSLLVLFMKYFQDNSSMTQQKTFWSNHLAPSKLASLF